jgi:hypothetical protein
MRQHCGNTLLENDSSSGRSLSAYRTRQGHYVLDVANIAAYPPADITIERIGHMVNVDLAMLLGNDAASRA